MPKSSQRKSKKVNKTTTKKRVNKNKKRSNRNKRSQSQRGGSVGSTTSTGIPSGIPSGNAKELLEICLEACKVMTPMIREFYIAISRGVSNVEGLQTLKSDKSVFTIADGMVQYLLKDILFKDKFKGIVGEEDAIIDLTGTTYKVDKENIPSMFNDIILKTKTQIEELASKVNSYQDKYVFIDPIDGTREFSTNRGYQSTVCIGFSNDDGTVWAGIVYRPIPIPNPVILEEDDKILDKEKDELNENEKTIKKRIVDKMIDDLNKDNKILDISTITYAYGCKSEDFKVEKLDKNPELKKFDKKKLLTSNKSISKFLEYFFDSKMNWERVNSGGAGNKMLMVLENKGTAYIQDRAVSRWDTCAAQAVIEAFGGVCSKLTSIVKGKGQSSYIYKQIETNKNLDYDNCYDPKDENKPYLSLYNYNKENPLFTNLDDKDYQNGILKIEDYIIKTLNKQQEIKIEKFIKTKKIQNIIKQNIRTQKQILDNIQIGEIKNCKEDKDFKTFVLNCKIDLLNLQREKFNISYFTPYINLCGIVAYIPRLQYSNIEEQIRSIATIVPPDYN